MSHAESVAFAEEISLDQYAHSTQVARPAGVEIQARLPRMKTEILSW
jgi:hypothetical protein